MNQQTLDRFLETYSRLLVHDTQKRLEITPAVQLNDGDARFLTTISSEMAFGPPQTDEMTEADWKRWAYDAATRLAESRAGVDLRYCKAAEIILARLGNFPGREYLRSRFTNPQTPVRYPAGLALEALAHEADNSIDFKGIGSRTLTDFQVKLVESLRRKRPVSVSAPTSAGKSYLLSLDIVSILADGTAKIIVYVVPTRALIRQVITDLLARLREAKLEEVAVSGAPVPLDDGQVAKGIIYVLTQERLLSLLFSPDGKVSVDALYVDEAQEIGDDERGMILHSAVREVITQFPACRLCFASPLTGNPGFLFSEFEITQQGEFFVERQAPVSQAVIILDEVKGTPKAIDVNILTPTGPQPVGRVDTNFDFRGVKERLAGTAVFVTKPDESTIVYANRPSDAIDIALKISELIEEKVTDQEVIDLIDFVRDHVHSQYALVDTLPKGVAFHYGKMPHLIRSQIEELLRKKKLRYVVCTSTLLQGINLPARNIVIHAPRKGNKRPMESPDFWNLAGRAGRLREGFSGNIWCISPSKWEQDPLNGKRLSEMTSSFRECLEDGDVRDALVAVLDNTAPLNSVINRNRVEQMFGKVFAEFTCQSKDVSQSTYAQNADQQQLAIIDGKCRGVLGRLAVPTDVCKRNSVISPLSLDELWKRFQKGPIAAMIPPNPSGGQALARMRDIFQIIDEVFIGSGTRSWFYYATLAYWWVSGQSLKELIANHLNYNKVQPTRTATNAAIMKFLNDLEQEVRFVYVKYLKAYIDTLDEFLTQTKQESLKKSISPIHLFIEYGAKDKVLVMLMSLGLSRSTAIFIRKSITPADDISRDECWAKLKQLSLNVLNVPAICKAEIRQLTGQGS